MRWLCQIVPGFVFAATFLMGCNLSHQTGEPHCSVPAGMVCCSFSGTPVSTGGVGCPFTCPSGSTLTPTSGCRWMPPPDGGRPPPGPHDAGSPPPPPPMCPEVRGQATCLDSFIAEPGRPFELPVTMDTCVCCAETSCSVAVGDVRGRPTLHLTTHMCPDPCDCISCNTAVASCAVPALDAGIYDVVVNGAPAFQLPVVEDSGFVPPPPACASYAARDECALSPPSISYRPWQPDMVCLAPDPARPERATLTVASECWSCGDLQGTCLVALEPRFTDDLPPGGELRITTTAHTTVCDVDCPGICIREERECELPPLVPGDFYRVWVDGEAVINFVAGDMTGTCVGITGPIPG